MAKIIVSATDGSTREYGLTKDSLTIGRVEKDNDIVLDSADASRQHCKLTREGEAWFVEDLKSRNGTRVNGRKVTKFELADGDEIQVGTVRLQFLAHADAPAAGGHDEIELEITLEEDAYVRFLGGPRQGEKVDLAGRVTIGRNPTNTIPLTEKGISGSHAELVQEGGHWIVRDLGSTNGTLVDGEKVVEAKLSPGAHVKIGVVELVFGQGANEGGESLDTQTRAVQVADLAADDVFAVSERNLARKQKAALGLWTFLLIAVVAGGAFWVQRGIRKDKKTEPAMNVPGNLVAQGASFEPDTTDGDYLSTDSDSVEYEETLQQRHTGQASLAVKASGGQGTQHLAFAKPLDHLSPSDRLTVSGWFRTSGLAGCAGITLLWQDEEGRSLGSSTVNAASGTSAFTETRGTVKPPFGTTRAIAAISVADGSGSFWVDDVAVERLPAEAERGLSAHGFEGCLEETGLLAVSRDSDEVFTEAGFCSLSGQTLVPASRLFTTARRTREANRSAIGGDALAFGTAGGGPVDYVLSTTETGMRFEASLGAKDPGLVLGLRVELGDGLATVAADGAQRHQDAFTREGVTAVVLDSGPRAIRIAMAEPATVRVIRQKTATWLILPVGEKDGAAHIAIDMQLDFELESAEVTALADAANKAEVADRAYGQAIKLYGDIVNRFPFRKDLTDRSAARLEELARKGEEQVQKLDKRSQEILFFRTFDLGYDAFAREAKAFAASFAGSDIAVRAQAVLDELTKAYDAVKSERNSALAANHLERGKDLLQPPVTRPALARGFFLSVLELAPGSPAAAEAQTQLEQIAKVLDQ
jgi:pSer/pThr/pTyr-binding forkhead associated (FHA) protein